MKLRPTECQRIMEQHGKAVDRMPKYSDDNCAVWLTLPDDDAMLRTILQKYSERQGQEAASERVITVAAADGSGDLMIPLSAELVESLNWREGDLLSVEVVDADTLVFQRL
ncbi:hypothetical protein [Cupriavidus sp. YAF13]|uniref:hypothetical protein n=1 Tax=Cupriavidus sp. YAF13 TaxID=3233075 RepID=UPI003F938A71